MQLCCCVRTYIKQLFTMSLSSNKTDTGVFNYSVSTRLTALAWRMGQGGGVVKTRLTGLTRLDNYVQ